MSELEVLVENVPTATSYLSKTFLVEVWISMLNEPEGSLSRSRWASNNRSLPVQSANNPQVLPCPATRSTWLAVLPLSLNQICSVSARLCLILGWSLQIVASPSFFQLELSSIFHASLFMLLTLFFNDQPHFYVMFSEEDMMEDERTTPPSSPSYSKKMCFAMLDQVSPESPLPKECQMMADVKSELQRRNSDRANHAIAFQGMHPGEAAAAMQAREHGSLTHAQIQRRMTNNSKSRLW